jgi:hypothetical protein
MDRLLYLLFENTKRVHLNRTGKINQGKTSKETMIGQVEHLRPPDRATRTRFSDILESTKTVNRWIGRVNATSNLFGFKNAFDFFFHHLLMLLVKSVQSKSVNEDDIAKMNETSLVDFVNAVSYINLFVIQQIATREKIYPLLDGEKCRTWTFAGCQRDVLMYYMDKTVADSFERGIQLCEVLLKLVGKMNLHTCLKKTVQFIHETRKTKRIKMTVDFTKLSPASFSTWEYFPVVTTAQSNFRKPPSISFPNLLNQDVISSLKRFNAMLVVKYTNPIDPHIIPLVIEIYNVSLDTEHFISKTFGITWASTNHSMMNKLDIHTFGAHVSLISSMMVLSRDNATYTKDYVNFTYSLCKFYKEYQYGDFSKEGQEKQVRALEPLLVMLANLLRSFRNPKLVPMTPNTNTNAKNVRIDEIVNALSNREGKYDKVREKIKVNYEPKFNEVVNVFLQTIAIVQPIMHKRGSLASGCLQITSHTMESTFVEQTRATASYVKELEDPVQRYVATLFVKLPDDQVNKLKHNLQHRLIGKVVDSLVDGRLVQIPGVTPVLRKVAGTAIHVARQWRRHTQGPYRPNQNSNRKLYTTNSTGTKFYKGIPTTQNTFKSTTI